MWYHVVASMIVEISIRYCEPLPTQTIPGLGNIRGSYVRGVTLASDRWKNYLVMDLVVAVQTTSYRSRRHRGVSPPTLVSHEGMDMECASAH